MKKIKQILKNTRVIILIFFIVAAFFMIRPQFDATGVAIRNVARNSTAERAGFSSPKATIAPTKRERITEINSIPIIDIDDYYDVLRAIPANRTVQITTDKGVYRVISGNSSEDIGLSVYNAPKTNIRLGLDLQGGTRVLLQPEEKLSSDQVTGLIENMKQRLNVYGLSDIVVRSTNDLSGNQFILVEIAGANEQEVKELLAKQGKFEAKIGNETVFKGGQDITYVCRTADCSGIDRRRGCQAIQEGQMCRFMFSITLTPESAQRQAEITKNLSIVTNQDRTYLNETLDLYLDDSFVDSLSIGSDLKGKAATEIAISGVGVGSDRGSAVTNSLANMKKLQTILVTGSLPVKLDIVRTDTISPALGREFTQNALFVGALAIIAVALVVLIRYRKIAIVLPILLITWLEIFLLIAFAAWIGWNIDVASIAGIIISIGTGLDDQIVITDETLKGKDEKEHSWKDKLKKAFFIVFAAYFTTVGSMVPLLFAGAGLLKGFAITTIIGLTLGVLVTRPAYANIIQILLKD
ncbi:MAG: Protein-export membrane protein SecD [Candidatus Woesearchaeota archaeon]|nr:Protein-export membrane protein SecD [Candidatus Woesearchaeota archaeon]